MKTSLKNMIIDMFGSDRIYANMITYKSGHFQKRDVTDWLCLSLDELINLLRQFQDEYGEVGLNIEVFNVKKGIEDIYIDIIGETMHCMYNNALFQYKLGGELFVTSSEQPIN